MLRRETKYMYNNIIPVTIKEKSMERDSIIFSKLSENEKNVICLHGENIRNKKNICTGGDKCIKK